MLKKWISICCTLAILAAGMTGGVHASESNSAADDTIDVVFTGNVEDDYIQFDEFGRAFEGMAPAETRTQAIRLTNQDAQTVNFYMRTNAESMTGAGGEPLTGAVYDITMESRIMDNAGEVLYSGAVGGQNKDLGDLVDEDGALKNAVLVATLKPGEKAVLSVTVTADGDSMDNGYQNAAGNLEFTFGVGYPPVPEPEKQVVQKVVEVPGEDKIVIVEKIRDVIVKTGDTAAIGILIGVLVISAALIVFIIVRKKKAGAKS